MASLITESDSRYERFSKFLISTEKSDFSDSLNELARTAVIQIIDEQLKTKHYRINVSAATKKGDYNFTGIIYRVSFKRDCDDENDESSIILKVAPTQNARRIQFHARAAFTREIFTYDQVSMPLSSWSETIKKPNFPLSIDFTSISCVRTGQVWRRQFHRIPQLLSNHWHWEQWVPIIAGFVYRRL